MKKPVITIAAVLALAVLAVVSYSTPKTFGNGVDVSRVNHISVFDGNTGVGFTIDKSEDIRYIVENT